MCGGLECGVVRRVRRPGGEAFAERAVSWEPASTRLEACESCHNPLPEAEATEQMEMSDVR